MIYVVTLCYNLFSECQKATERLYKQNEGTKFKHILADCGFPLITDTIPDDIEEAKEKNTECLKSLAHRFGSEYLKINNEGVSQNHTQVWFHLNPNDEDSYITACPDEAQVEDGWLQAMDDVLKELGYCAPHLTEHTELLANSPHAKKETINGREVYVMLGNINYGTLGVSCRMMNAMGGIAYPSNMPIYGGIESILIHESKRLKERWGLLKDFRTEHTDFEKGNIGTSSLLRSWKNTIIFGKRGQMPFDIWLQEEKARPKMEIVK